MEWMNGCGRNCSAAVDQFWIVDFWLLQTLINQNCKKVNDQSNCSASNEEIDNPVTHTIDGSFSRRILPRYFFNVGVSLSERSFKPFKKTHRMSIPSQPIAPRNIA
jgi:hypothetical protein